MRNGADVNARQSDGSTSLDILCRRSNQFSASKENESLFLDIVRLLIQYSLDVNAKGRYRHPLEELFWRARIDGTLMFEAVTILIEHGLDLTVKWNNFGKSLITSVQRNADYKELLLNITRLVS